MAEKSSTTIEKENSTAMQDSPRVSVVIPVYNAGQFIRQTLDSLLAQSLQEFEIICVDDNSTDDSYEILQEYQKRDKRIRLLRNTVPSDGAGMARNLGMAAAKGKYLSILDADDFFEPDLLETGYRKLEETQADCFVYDKYTYDNKFRLDMNIRNRVGPPILRKIYLRDREVFKPSEYPKEIFQMMDCEAWSYMYRRSFIDRSGLHFPSAHYGEDLFFCFLTCVCAERIAWSPKKLVHYRTNNPLSQVGIKSRWPEDCCRVVYAWKQELERRGLYETYQISYVKRALHFVFYHLYVMDNFHGMKKLYSDFREEYVEKLGVFEIPDNELGNKRWVTIRDNIMRYATLEEFLFVDWKRFQSNDLRTIADNVFVKKAIPADTKIAVYGAGNVGKAVFSNLLYESHIQICAWVDKKYCELGFPIGDPERLSEISFDYIVVAVEDEGIWKEIGRYLSEMGIEEEKLLWIGDLEDEWRRKEIC